ncbi:MAG TPA: magnesium-translocating P-type ATPase [Actinomycetes bacterium]|jgi:Mg2+-importing ATPase|nr:magnesium-translocating P-type ATPase [Actinomycetes bacterium]
MTEAAPPVSSAWSQRPALDLAAAARHPVDAVLHELGSTQTGLTSDQAARRLATVGRNVLASHKVTALGVLGRQLRNPLLILLLAAAGVSAATGDPTDGAIIAAIVVLSVGLGFINEYRSEVAVAALHANIRHEALVWRDGRQQRLDVRDLVPGDVVALRVGDLVPADLRLLEADQLECDEAVLTGEPMPAVKSAATVPAGDSAVDLPACAFMGTVVHQGAGRGVVVATGSATAFGKIAVGLAERQAETAFQAGLRGFSKLLVGVAAVLTTSIFVINVAFHRPLLDALLFSLAIAIGITPQLLPAIVSVSLSTGSRELARRRVLVKRLVTIEDLGNIEVLFTDKTGTLTEGAITFDQALDPAGLPATWPLLLGLVCNEATMTANGPVGGNALDVALWSAPAAAALAADATGGPLTYQRLGLAPFDHDRQLASVTVRTSTGATPLVVKGAPEAVLARCVDVPADASKSLERLFADGARVVAVATRDAPGLTTPGPADEHDLHLVGFLTFVDRPKTDAGASIAKLNGLGVAVKVITGDNPIVATKVCRDLGLDLEGVRTGAELERLDNEALAAAIPHTTVFARVSPDQKSRIIKVARRTGVDVAFLGDGVNDAVALHAADVGISVESATDVAKDAADIVLLDKDLGVLADGVTEGRRIFANTLKYVLMATSSNFGNMFSAAGASLFLSFLPMLPSQILLNNLLYDAGQLAIPTDRVDPEVLARPAAWDIGFVRRFMLVFGPVSSVFDFLTFLVMLQLLHATHSEFRSGWFVESLATQTLVVYVIRTRRVPFFRSRPSLPMFITPVTCALIGAVLPFTPLAGFLGFATLPVSFFLILLGMIATYLLLVEIVKRRFYAVQARPRRPPATHQERRQRRIQRRAARFTQHATPHSARVRIP